MRQVKHRIGLSIEYLFSKKMFFQTFVGGFSFQLLTQKQNFIIYKIKRTFCEVQFSSFTFRNLESIPHIYIICFWYVCLFVCLSVSNKRRNSWADQFWILLQLTWSQGTVYWRPKFSKHTATMKIWLWKYIFFYLSWLSWIYQIMFLIILNLPDFVSDYPEPTRLYFW